MSSRSLARLFVSHSIWFHLSSHYYRHWLLVVIVVDIGVYGAVMSSAAGSFLKATFLVVSLSPPLVFASELLAWVAHVLCLCVCVCVRACVHACRILSLYIWWQQQQQEKVRFKLNATIYPHASCIVRAGMSAHIVCQSELSCTLSVNVMTISWQTCLYSFIHSFIFFWHIFCLFCLLTLN